MNDSSVTIKTFTEGFMKNRHIMLVDEKDLKLTIRREINTKACD